MQINYLTTAPYDQVLVFSTMLLPIGEQTFKNLVADSTDAETKAIFHASKKACSLRHFIASEGFMVD